MIQATNKVLMVLMVQAISFRICTTLTVLKNSRKRNMYTHFRQEPEKKKNLLSTAKYRDRLEFLNFFVSIRQHALNFRRIYHMSNLP